MLRAGDIARRAVGALWSGQTWRCTLHLTTGAPLAAVTCSITVALLGVTVALAVTALLAVPSLAALLGAGVQALAGLDVTAARALLQPSEPEQVAELSRRVETLSASRAAVVDAADVERRASNATCTMARGSDSSRSRCASA